MKKIHVVSIIILCTILYLPIFSNTADAITGNSDSDSTPYVGVVVLFSDAARENPIGYCSGVLLSPTVMVTAGHSLLGVEAVSVCFDEGPFYYSIEEGKLVYYGAETIYDGTPADRCLYYIPSMSGNNEFQTSDVGLILFDEPVGVTEFAELPPAGLVDTLAAKTGLRVVGYGFQNQVTPRNNDPLISWILGGEISRRTAQVELLPNNFQGSEHYLKFTANTAQGKGAITFGDSGGPVLCTIDGQEFVVAISAFVTSNNCNGVAYGTILDQPEIMTWINGYLGGSD